ncbi:MAG: membrane protein insertion efficiency factor YidD [Clostridia bacterium]|nr:membrane protein insertion efficiency factor YidD [Clostridia bacterium]
MRINTRKKFEKEIDFFSDEFQQEQKRLETYIKQRPLPRPKTTKSVVITWVLIYLLVAFLLAATVIYLFKITKIQWLCYLVSYIVCALFFSKTICIKAIECYQHYAKEETRRKCVCVPSCSEYSIAVLKKYHIFKALRKIRIRLLNTCGGYGYVHDEP